MNRDIDNSQDILDSRDIFERIEELEEIKDDMLTDVPESEYGNSANEKWVAWEESEEYTELKNLSDFMDEFKGYGGDEEWRGDWYPVTLIRDTYFEEYAQELAEDIGAIDKNAQWPNNCIDWEHAARELQYDYSSAAFDGVTYWAR